MPDITKTHLPVAASLKDTDMMGDLTYEIGTGSLEAAVWNGIPGVLRNGIHFIPFSNLGEVTLVAAEKKAPSPRRGRPPKSPPVVPVAGEDNDSTATQ